MTTKRVYFLFILTAILFGGCKKEEKQRYYGIDTIDNQLYGQSVYYAIGFSFEEGKLLPTHEQPNPDITVHAISDNGGLVTGAYLDTPILVPPFSLAGDFDLQSEAILFYENLLSVYSPSWVSSANPVDVNQVWILRTGKGNYAKFRVIDLIMENRSEGPFVEISFEWRIQADGSSSFPE